MEKHPKEQSVHTSFIGCFSYPDFIFFQLSGAVLDYLAYLSIHPLPAPDPANLTILQNKPTTSHHTDQKFAPTFLTLVNDQAI